MDWGFYVRVHGSTLNGSISRVENRLNNPFPVALAVRHAEGRLGCYESWRSLVDDDVVR